jgi:tetratricopeptide (TPR) repeat protein
MMKSSLSMAPSPTPKHGRYELKAEVARGGMGVVYRAHDKLADREVAYKRLMVPESRARARFVALFQREYNTLVQLAHPAIVEVYEYGFDEVGPFYTMELLDGQGLMELAPLPVKEVCRILRDTSSALALLHARRLLHRDLSPANVRVNKDGSAKLIDFGALVPFGPAPDVVGTPAFMAPESFDGQKLDQRADLYALGALAYWALTRRIAVRAQTLDDLPMAWLDPIVPPTMHVPEIPKALEDLVLALLSRDPLARPSSAAEVMERLTAIGDLDAEPEEQRVAASYVAHPPLVGRELPIMHLEQALGAIADKIGSCLLVEAEQGLGKSAFLAEVTVRAQLHGATVLRGEAGADTSSFGLARSLVRVANALYPDLLSTTSKKDSFFQQVLEPRRLARVETAWSPVLASERQARTLALMQEMLLRAAAHNPLVIVVDELQRADSESLALLATLSTECRDHSLLLVLAANVEARGSAREQNQDATSSDAYLKIKSCSRPIKLEALNNGQTLELTTALFGGAANTQRATSWLHERSGGNPARMMDLTRLLLQRKLIHYTGGTFTLPHDVPADVAWEDSGAALLGRLANLSEQARACAAVLSLQEMPLRQEHLATTLKAELRDVVLALEELTARAIISVSDERAALLSVALRDALAQTLGDAERRDLHVRAARAILAEPHLDGSLRMQAGVHLLKAGEEREAVELLTARGDGDFLSGSTPIPLLETVLEVLRRQGRKDEHCLGVLVPLVRGGFFGDPGAQRRHIDRTLLALANVSGVSTMQRLTPRFGAKLAFIFGLVGALVRHARTPKNLRYGSFPETVAALLSILSAATAACACSFESEQGFQIVKMFEPLRGFGPDSAPYWSMEFCLATSEIGAGQYGAARVRYERLLERFKHPIKGMNEEIHLQFNQGILHGLAQCKVTDTDATCLKLAEELENAHMFFAPHAQSVRMGYHGYRGETERSDQHRKQGEMLALRGGISWSSATIMAMRSAYMAMGNNDTVGVMRGISELERLAPVAPKMVLYRDVMQACLELLRGRAERAVDGFERVFASRDAKHMIAHYFDMTIYAKALAAAGRHADAKRVCEQTLASFGPHEALYVKKGLYQQIALSEAAEGNVEQAARILDDMIAQLARFQNPLWSGLAHRDRAKVALVAQDQAAFEHHAKAMATCFGSTKTPALIQQCDQLQAAARAQARGARRTAALDESAMAFESSQSSLFTVDDMDRFQTEAMPSTPPANDQTG